VIVFTTRMSHAMKMHVIAIRVIGGLVRVSADRQSLVTRARIITHLRV